MNIILGVFNGVLQYRRGKETGLAGIFGLVITLLIVFQWHNLVPVFRRLGIIDLLDRHGLIFEGAPELTGAAIFGIAVLAAYTFMIVGFLVIVIGVIIAIFFSSEIGFKISISVLLIPMIPIMVIWMVYDHFKTPTVVRKTQRLERIKHQERMKKPIIERIVDSSEQVSREEALNRLNSLPTLIDDTFLVGISGIPGEEKYYVILPRPINMKTAEFSKGDLAVVKYNVEKYKRPLFYDIGKTEPKEFILTPVDKWGKKIMAMPSKEMKRFYLTNHDDFLNHFKEFKSDAHYSLYVEYISSFYFKTKDSLLTLISAEMDSSKFDELVNRATSLNASNEDEVKLLYELKGN
jgi:hypothetical protein